MRKFITFFLVVFFGTVLFAQTDADFTADIHFGFKSQVVNFTDQSNANPIGWDWDFDNDGTVDSQVQNPTHTFNEAGVHVVALTASFFSLTGTVQDTKLDTIVIYEIKFDAITASGDTVGAIPFAVQFADRTFDDFQNNLPPLPVSFAWDFGDGNTSTEQHPVHSYDTGGYYDVSLEITLDENLTVNTYLVQDELIKWDRNDPDVSYIRVYDVDFTKDILWGFAPQVVNFTDISVPTPDAWNWDLDFQNAPMQIDSNVQNPQFTYNDAGPYYNIFQAIYNHPDGPDTVTVYDSVAIFLVDFHATEDFSDPDIVDSVGMVNFEINFTDYYTWRPWIDAGLQSWLPPADLVTWDWDFGTGDFDTVENPYYIYTDCGFYDVELTMEIDPQMTINQVLATQTHVKWDPADPDNWYIWVKGPISALVCDNSESMMYDNKAGTLINAAGSYINLFDPGFQISVVKFREWAETLFEMELYDYDGTNSPLNAANSTLGGMGNPLGYSGPGEGLIEGLNQCLNHSDPTPASQIFEAVNNPQDIVDTIHVVLFTDGLENCAPALNPNPPFNGTILNWIAGQAWAPYLKIHTITMGSNTTMFALMQAIAQNFQGVYHDASTDNIVNIMQDISVAMRGPAATRIANIAGSFDPSDASRTLPEHQVYVDSYAKDVTFVLNWDKPQADLFFELIAPDGTIAFERATLLTHALPSSETNINYTIKNPIPGAWTVRISDNSVGKYRNVNYELYAHASSELTGKLYFAQETPLPGDPLDVTAVLRDVHGEAYSVDNVYAEITRPDASIEYVTLTNSSPNHYTTQYTNTSLEGAYRFRIYVEAHNSQGEIRRSFGYTKALVNDNSRLADGEDVNNIEKFTVRNYPNPFNPETTIEFSLPAKEAVTVDIYNIKGERVTRLVNSEVYESGVHSVKWNGVDSQNKQVGSGTYFYKVKTPAHSEVKKMILLK